MGCCNQNTDVDFLCYCFNITKAAYQKALRQGEDALLKDFVVFQTKNNFCNCENLNPSKKCCLKDFKAIKNQHQS